MAKKKEPEVVPEEMTLHQKILAIQSRLSVRKTLFNKFGNYYYRSNETILESLKPLLQEYGLIMKQRDELEEYAGKVYIKSIATVSDGVEKVENVAYAQEDQTTKGQVGPMRTGSASSYARKYCQNGLWLLDDAKDCDTNEYGKETEARQSEVNKKWHKAISDWYSRCECEEEVTKMQAWILKKEGVAHYTEYIDNKAQELIDGFHNQTKGE